MTEPAGIDLPSTVAARLRFLWPVKGIGTALCMASFFVVYFWLLRHPLFPVAQVPRIFVDRAIPFTPAALPLYVSLWFYIAIPPALLGSRRQLAFYTGAAVALSLAGFVVFLFWPTAAPIPAEDLARYPALGRLKAVDAAGNALPSLHAAFAVFTAFWLGRILRELEAGKAVRAVNWLWCAGIVYSTVAVRQHVVLDALAGGLLGLAVAVLHARALGPGPLRPPEARR